MTGNLYVVATPIGNLQDISQRALDIFSKVDIIAAEDTRKSGLLLKHFGIKASFTAYHDHNEKNKAVLLCRQLQDGKNIALITDAGTPCISDPGYSLVNLARKEGIPVMTIPGPSSITAALSVSGLPCDQFFYTGFLPRKKGRKSKLEFLAGLPVTIVILESPYRVLKTLADLEFYFGNRIISICRELTKIYEEVRIGSIREIRDSFHQKEPRGEFVILVANQDYKF